ncbi:unnamed protein product [Closterium sp. Naga37s-1]|nr:unnamed protein product [Closterium sp. Naga37s-1]
MPAPMPAVMPAVMPAAVLKCPPVFSSPKTSQLSPAKPSLPFSHLQPPHFPPPPLQVCNIFHTDLNRFQMVCNIFHTDLIGFQMVRRERLARIPLQGNFYPMPAWPSCNTPRACAASLQVSSSSLHLLSPHGSPLSSRGHTPLPANPRPILPHARLAFLQHPSGLGFSAHTRQAMECASLKDDGRGLTQGVSDNYPLLSLLSLLSRLRSSPPLVPSPPSSPSERLATDGARPKAEPGRWKGAHSRRP